MVTMQDISEIEEFYRGASIFITGGTGFLGKLIIEKLLRSCPRIKKIYILCRPKKGKEVKTRLAKLFDDTLYDTVRKTDPEFHSKIVAVHGDCNEVNLGISDEDLKMLFKEVNVIFHCAATVRFDEPFHKVVRINVRGTHSLLLLARSVEHLKALVYVSTAYSNCVQDHIEEKLYNPPIDGHLLMKIAETVDEDTLNRIKPGLIGKYPNTYTYSKAVAEDIVKQNSEGLPVCIVRPAIVISTCKEPVAGWCDNINGPTGAAAAILLGILHTSPCDANTIAALVPADYVVNTTIVTAWNIAQTWNKHQQNDFTSSNNLLCTNDIPVYNYTGCTERAVTWGNFIKTGVVWCKATPALDCLWIYFVIITKSKSIDFICRCLFHLLPAYILHGFLFLIGKRSSLLKHYQLLHKMIDALAYFSSNKWKFDTKNTQNLYDKLNDTDKKLFNFNMSSMNWNEYMESYITGVRVYILKDPITTVPQARRKYMVLGVVNKILWIVLIFFFYSLYVFLRSLL